MGVVRVPYITFYHRKWLAVTMSLSCTVSQTYQLFRLCDGMWSSTVSILGYKLQQKNLQPYMISHSSVSKC